MTKKMHAEHELTVSLILSGKNPLNTSANSAWLNAKSFNRYLEAPVSQEAATVVEPSAITNCISTAIVCVLRMHQ